MPNNDLISRAAAIDALTDTNLRRNVDSVCDGDMNRTRRAAKRVIAQLPTIDAAPVVHARWTTHRTLEHDGEWYCTNCDYEPTVFENTNYCPNCGAKMDGGDNG